MPRITNGPFSYWVQNGGKRATMQIQRYQGTIGNSDFIANGGKPKCPSCKRAKMKPVLEVEQLGLFASAFNLVMRCSYADCKAMAIYNYELEYNESGNGDNGR